MSGISVYPPSSEVKKKMKRRFVVVAGCYSLYCCSVECKWERCYGFQMTWDYYKTIRTSPFRCVQKHSYWWHLVFCCVCFFFCNRSVAAGCRWKKKTIRHQIHYGYEFLHFMHLNLEHSWLHLLRLRDWRERKPWKDSSDEPRVKNWLFFLLLREWEEYRIRRRNALSRPRNRLN